MSLPGDLFALTKPRVVSLLLLTAVAPMFITDRGLPSPALVGWVLLAGFLMAGGANAINMWFDRDVDTVMSRTRLRPVASGRLAPPAALAFGIGLGAVAFLLFWRFVARSPPGWHWQVALLCLRLHLWLKRSTPQNIVIGGAAGAFRPLVGWAAMTGRIDLAALYLFAIIFYWTPPHFWALALIKKDDYARAGIPMLPVVQGARRTKVQMLAYTIMLVPLTILPWLSGNQGALYVITAALLGGRLLWYCVRLLARPAPRPRWRGHVQVSLVYLALLFVASVNR
jgi:protoheme IX farnesyltransferase